MQFESNESFTLVNTSSNLYKFVLPMAVQYQERWYHAGSCCLLAANLAVTAKHILEWMYLQVAGAKVDMYDPDLKDPDHGFIFSLPDEMGLDVYQFGYDGGTARRFSVVGFYRVGFKDTDLILLRIEPHPLCSYRDDPVDTDVPIFDLVPPRAGLEVEGFGYPDHPKHENSELPTEHYADYFLYHSSGIVEAINTEVGSAPLASFQTSMRTHSGMSGGPVFVKRNGDRVCCGIISRGGAVDYSLITPIWTVVGGQIHPVNDMPVRYGASCILDLMQAGRIQAVDANRFSLLNYEEKQEFRIICDEPSLLKNGY